MDPVLGSSTVIAVALLIGAGALLQVLALLF